MRDISNYFSENSLGSPLRFASGIFSEDLIADPGNMNDAVSKAIANLDLLYESVAQEVRVSMDLSTYMNTQLEKLRIKRKKLTAQIEEYLFANENSDGYFYSFLDTFPDLDYVDLNLTSAFVDIKSGSVTLPVNGDTTQVFLGSSVKFLSSEFYVNGDQITSGISRSPFGGCLDGLSNTYWSDEVVTSTPSEVVCILDLELNAPLISSVEYTPYGTSESQVFVEVGDFQRNFQSFGSSIKTGLDKMTFSLEQVSARHVRITIRKTTYDYIVQADTGVKYHYILGAKDIVFIGKNYVNDRIFVSKPISVSSDLLKDNVLDAVALKVDEDIPDFTSIDYFVALDNGTNNTSVFDFDWKKISPYTDEGNASNTVVSFNGSSNISKYIRKNPDSKDLRIIPEDRNNPDTRIRNPFLKDAVELYRLCDFGLERPLIPSLRLQDGVKCLKVLYTNFDQDSLSLDFWADYINGSKTAEIIYPRIDTANGFFWGGDIGENSKSVYMETKLECPSAKSAGVQKFVKVDLNSQLWAIRIYLNGTQIGDLPVGVNELNIPWNFVEGENTISITATIPRGGVVARPNEGSILLMQDNDLSDFGSVRLANWNYVDIFELLNNSNTNQNSFAIYNDADKVQLVTRKKPSDNYFLSYSTATSSVNQKVRIRADFKRPDNKTSIAPVLNSYRLRFRYA